MIVDPAALVGAFRFRATAVTVSGVNPTSLVGANPNRIAIWIFPSTNTTAQVFPTNAGTVAAGMFITSTTTVLAFNFQQHGGITQLAWSVGPTTAPTVIVWEEFYQPELLHAGEA